MTVSRALAPPRRALFFRLLPAAPIALLLALLVALAPAPARAQVPAIGTIEIDTAPLRAQGVREYADLLEAALQRSLASRLADRRARGGARLVVRLDRFFMPIYTGPEADDRFGFGLGASMAADTLEGEALLVSQGAVIARVPLVVSLPAGQSGPWYLPDAEPRRAAAVADAFAGWVARRL